MRLCFLTRLAFIEVPPYLEEIIKMNFFVTGTDNYWLSPVIRDDAIEENTELYFLMLFIEKN